MDILWNITTQQYIYQGFITSVGMASPMLEVFIFVVIVAFIYAFVFGMVYILDSMINSGVAGRKPTALII